MGLGLALGCSSSHADRVVELHLVRGRVRVGIRVSVRV